MRQFAAILFAALTLSFSFPTCAAYTAYTAPSEQQCSEMVDRQLLSMKAAAEKDGEKSPSAYQQAEKIVSANRRHKVSDCKTWRTVQKLANH